MQTNKYNIASCDIFGIALLVGVAVSVARANEPFTIVALPDTQSYVVNATNAPLFTQQTQWIADQIQVAGNPRNIQFVTHLGDVVTNGTNLTEWQRADATMDVLDGVVKYSVLPGNHDYANYKIDGTADYLANFGPQRYAGYSWYAGADPSGNNSFQRFSAGGYDFIHMALEYQPTVNLPFRDTSPIEWAQSVIDANPNTPVILSTHDYVNDEPAGRSAAGDALWDQLIRRNDQIFLVLAGHFHSLSGTNQGEYHQISLNDAGRPVFEMLQNFQDYVNGGNGWLRLLNFDIPNNQIAVETYSPVLNQFQTERVITAGQHASQFELAIDFPSRLTPVILPPPLVFQNGLNGYAGTQDKEIRSRGNDASIGQAVLINVDGDDGDPDLKPNQVLIRFDDIIGPGAGQLSPDAEIVRALLVLQVEDSGSGFTVHEMLTPWNESSTWQGLGGGVQTDGVEAVAVPIAAFGADNDSANVKVGALQIDVTSTIEAYMNGSLANYGWALLPYTNGTNGLYFFSSENTDIDLRPQLQIFLSESALPAPVIPPPPLVFQNGLNGYAGTQDKEIRSRGNDASIGQAVLINVDGDDGDPDLKPNQVLIRFDDIIGPGAGQLSPDAEIVRALLVLQVEDSGSGFTVHEMLTPWNESSTWQGLGGGVQADGVEAVAVPIAAFGADNDSANVKVGTLQIDVTATIEAYMNGSLANHGWVLLPYTNGTNGVYFFSSENTDIDLRPQLQIFLRESALFGDFNKDNTVDGGDYVTWRKNTDNLSLPNDNGLTNQDDRYALWRAYFGDPQGAGSGAAATSAAPAHAPIPEPTTLVLLLLAVAPLYIRRHQNLTLVSELIQA